MFDVSTRQAVMVYQTEKQTFDDCCLVLSPVRSICSSELTWLCSDWFSVCTMTNITYMLVGLSLNGTPDIIDSPAEVIESQLDDKTFEAKGSVSKILTLVVNTTI